MNDCQSIFTRGISSKSAQIRGTLAMIESEEENKFIMRNAKSLNFKGEFFIWLGGRRTQDGKWVWLDGIELKFENWADGQPDNYKETEDKLTLILKDVTYWQFNAGEWNDAHEKYNFGFVCQYSASKTGIGII